LTPFVKYVIAPLPMSMEFEFLAQQYFKGHAVVQDQEIWVLHLRDDVVHGILLELNKKMPYTILTVTKTIWPQGFEVWHRQYVYGRSIERHARRIY